jgi:hypothetical protein
MTLIYLAYPETSDWYDPDDVFEIPANCKEAIKDLMEAGAEKVGEKYVRNAKWIIAYEPWAYSTPRETWRMWNSYRKDHVRDPWAEIYL